MDEQNQIEGFDVFQIMGCNSWRNERIETGW